MPAGGPGDHPLTDIINFHLKVNNKKCDELIRQISKYVSVNELYDMLNWFDNYYITEEQLKELRLNERQIIAVLFVNDKGRINDSDYQKLNDCS